MLRQALNERWMFRASKIPIATLMPFLVILWIIGVSFLVMTVFQSLLVSKLTIVKAQPVVDSATDLITKKNVLGWTVPEIELQEVLKDSGIPAYEKLWDKLEPEMTTEDVLTDKYIKQVEKGKAAIVHGQLIMRNGLSEYFKEHGKCNLHVSSNVIYPFPLLVALRKSLSKEFVEKFNAGLTRLIAADISGKWFKPVFQASNLCTSYSDNELKPLELKNILGVIVIWCFGIATSILCFIVEICFNKKIQ
nr:glutamate receptor ionotropic, kainate 2-like [Parasteatoda tepidariorum]